MNIYHASYITQFTIKIVGLQLVGMRTNTSYVNYKHAVLCEVCHDVAIEPVWQPFMVNFFTLPQLMWRMRHAWM